MNIVARLTRRPATRPVSSDDPQPQPGTPHRLAAGALLTMAASIVGLFFAVAPASASVAALSYTPTFGCTSTTLNVAQVDLNEHIGTVRVEAEVDVYNGKNWVLYAASSVVSVNTNQAFSELLGPSFNFRVASRYYYDTFIWTSVNGAAWTYYPAQALRDRYSNTICLAS